MAVAFGALASALVASPRPGVAEVIGPLLPKGSFEIGIQDRYVDRTQVANAGESVIDRRDLALVVRWAFSEFATISFEGMTGTSSFVSGFDDLEVFYLIGGGLQGTLWRNERCVVTAGLEYTETYRRFDDADTCDRGTYALCWQLLAQTDFGLSGSQVTVFAGPAYSEDDLFVLEGINCYRVEFDSDPNWGAVLGAVILIGGHVTINGQVLWVENPQPRFGIGYRF